MMNWFGPRALILVMAALVALASSTNLSMADETQELERTWQGGLMFVPHRGGVAWGPVEELMPWVQEETVLEGPHPVVIYMHGCSGLDGISRQVGNFYAEEGYLVFAPDSFARENKPLSCDPETNESSLHRGVLVWRQRELANALEEVSALEFVDRSRIFTHGFSEGAITAATFEGAGLSARIVEGWTCHAGWVEYTGINAAANEPVLTMVAESDPWFQAAYARGNCGRFLNSDNGSRSVVFPASHPLGQSHYLMWHPEGASEVFEFLSQFDGR